MHNFNCKSWVVTDIYIFQKISIIWKTNKSQFKLLKLKKINSQNIKRLPNSVYFMKVKNNAPESICFIILCYSFVITIFKLKLNTFVTKYTDTFKDRLSVAFIYRVVFIWRWPLIKVWLYNIYKILRIILDSW